jgi:Ca2+-binding RTX toxin-like protein
MRRASPLLVMVVAHVVGSGVALAAVKVGTDGSDYLVGTGSEDLLSGRGGNDGIVGKGGDDILYGGKGQRLPV